MIAIERGVLLAPPLPLSRFEITALLERLMETLGLSGDLTLALVDDAAMAGLNLRCLGCAGPTNVLAFPAEEDGVLGEIALAPAVCLREARLYGQDPRLHLARLLAHALLHLAGLDHGPEMEALTEAAAEQALA
jgi:probable rRNA maturation factor